MLLNLFLPYFMITTQPFFVFTPPWFWLIGGLVLIAGDVSFLRKISTTFRFILSSMGAGAIFVALVLWRGGIFFGVNWNYLMYDEFETQILYWMGVSASFAIWIRPVLIPRRKYVIHSTQEGITLTEILPAKPGRVLYEGSSWPAITADTEGNIPADEKVYILRREGNTLVVASQSFFDSLKS